MLCLTTALCAALTPPSRPLAARGLTQSLAASASGSQRQILLVAAGVLAKSGRVLLQQRSDPPQLAGCGSSPAARWTPAKRSKSSRASSTRSSRSSVEETDLEPIAFTSHHSTTWPLNAGLRRPRLGRRGRAPRASRPPGSRPGRCPAPTSAPAARRLSSPIGPVRRFAAARACRRRDGSSRRAAATERRARVSRSRLRRRRG